MKPILLIVNEKEVKDDKILIDKSKLQELIDEAYKSGYAEGQSSMMPYTKYIYLSGNRDWSKDYQQTPYYPYTPTITCETPNGSDGTGNSNSINLNRTKGV